VKGQSQNIACVETMVFETNSMVVFISWSDETAI